MNPWCVIAYNSDGEFWAYGPFTTKQEAEELADRLANAPLEITYEVGELFPGAEM